MNSELFPAGILRVDSITGARPNPPDVPVINTFVIVLLTIKDTIFKIKIGWYFGGLTPFTLPSNKF